MTTAASQRHTNTQQVIETARAWIKAGRAELPLPGEGATWERWQALLALAREDLPAARILEAHVDARSIRQELGDEVASASTTDELWGVWAAEPPTPRVTATHRSAGWRLSGTKAWCSAASFATHALITADVKQHSNEKGEFTSPRLFAVDLRQAGVTPAAPNWASQGMAGTDTGEVSFENVTARTVGGPVDYLDRAGFWHGGIGVANCWWGGAQGLIDILAERLRKRAVPTAEAHLGACIAWDVAITGALRSAAEDVDAAPDHIQAARIRAFALRSLIDRACADVVQRFGRALGAAPFAADQAAAQRLADLQVYTRQSHAERDEIELARLSLKHSSHG